MVGAGASGAAVAARLATGGRRVLLLEAGPVDTKVEVHIPAAFAKLFRTSWDWNYDTEPQSTLDGRRIYWPRGRMLGGSTSMNAMMWVRGFAADYDHWGEVVGAGWSWESLLPFFREIEQVMIDPTDPAGPDADRSEFGLDGAIHVEPQRSPRPLTAQFLAAANEIGVPTVHPNTRAPLGVSRTMVSQHRGARWSTADGYLRPAAADPNLVVRTGAQATRVLFDGHHACAVEYLSDGKHHTATALGDIVLSGGAVNTPQLLMLSGIGDGRQLHALGIDVLVDAPEVGANLQDHLLSGLAVEAFGDTLFHAEQPHRLVDYLARRRGMLTSNVAEAYGFVKTRNALELPDIELIFAPVAYVGEGLVAHPGHGITVGAILLQPESSGTVSLATTDPLDPPLIDPQYLSDPGGQDRATLLAGLQICERILAAPSLAGAHTGRFIAPLDGAGSQQQRAELAVQQMSHTLYHPVGTARMGSDATSVVDPQLRDRGVTGLRVADASVMPRIIRGHTAAPSIVVGEKAAALILADPAGSDGAP
ncbi:MAG: GMC family oxidoreductase N-terminal domain-containing protein [Nakamurella sp.]